MGSIWDDRLAEVWAPPGRAGSGVVIGAFGVLTARHLVAEVADGSDAGPVLARVVRRGSASTWVPMRVLDHAPEWDLAVLEVDKSSAKVEAWTRPTTPSPKAVMLGGASEDGCEAVGFPNEEVQRPEGSTDPGELVRQTEQLRGILLPSGQAKPPTAPRSPLPREWMPLDASTATVGDQTGWQGMSGAGVVLPDGRLAGIVVTAETGHQQRRLYVVPIAAVLGQSAELAGAMAAVAGGPLVAEARAAPTYRRVLYRASLPADGIPLLLGEITDLGILGVKPVGLTGEPPYLNYVARDDDDRLTHALREAVASNRMLLLVGDSGAGKTRSAAQIACGELPAHRLLRPKEDRLPELLELPLTDLGAALVWLDDVERYAHPALGAILEQLLNADVAVVGTIRRQELKALGSTGEVRNPSGEALTDARLVFRVDWKRKWSDAERERTSQHVRNPSAQRAVAEGLPLSVWAVAGPQLVKRRVEAEGDEDRPCRFALLRAVLDWYRTGLTTSTPVRVAVELVTEGYLDGEPSEEDITDAIEWSTERIGIGGREAHYSLLMCQDDRLAVNDYVQDHDRRMEQSKVPDCTWSAALAKASDPTSTSAVGVGVAAYWADRLDLADRAFKLGLQADDLATRRESANGLAELADLLDDFPAATRWREIAASQSDTPADYNDAVDAQQQDQPSRVERWYRTEGQGVVIEHELVTLDYDGARYYKTTTRRLVNRSRVPIMRFPIRVAVDRYPKDARRSVAFYRRNRLTVDELGLQARCGDEPMTWKVEENRNSYKGIWLLFENEQSRFRLDPGESCSVSYVYAVGDDKWGTWLQRSARIPTSHFSILLSFPAALKPALRGRETSLAPNPTELVVTEIREANRIVFASEIHQPPLNARYRFEWDFGGVD